MRRRQFLAATAVAAGAGWSSRSTPPAGSLPPDSSTGSSAVSAAGAAPTTVAETTPVGRPGTPQGILQRSTVPVRCYHQIRKQTATDSADARPLICPPSVLEGHLRALTEAGIH